MKIKIDDLKWAANKGIISEQQAESLWNTLSERVADRPGFKLAHIFYYFGALLVISAMGWFMNTTWEVFGGPGIVAISGLYAVIFILCAHKLQHNTTMNIPCGLLITMAVCMTPLIVYGLQRWLNVWAFDDPGEYQSFHRWIKGGWFWMEIATIAAGLVALRFYKFAFLTAPIAFTLWYLSMDLTPILFEGDDYSFNERKWVSLVFGLFMILGSYFVDLKSKNDFSFWGYLFGTIAFWGGLSLMDSNNELSRLFYFLINITMLGTAVFLQRKVFLIFGGIGCFAYFAHLASALFEDSMFFPFALTLLGIAILYFGILINRHGRKIEANLISAMPQWMRALRPSERT
jgi:hypothetical protein